MFRRAAALALVLASAGLLCALTFTQQGAKLVGTGTVGTNQVLGISVALSGDGNTAIAGAQSDGTGGFPGAAFVYTRTGSTWTQQGAKLPGAAPGGNSGGPGGVALSFDGNTAIAGQVGTGTLGVSAAQIWTRSGTTWTLQQYVVATGSPGTSSRVSISADGNTALMGTYTDASNIGACWIWTRSGGVWTMQQKLVGTSAIGAALQGISGALSSDGNTAVCGGSGDNTGQGAGWIWTRSGGVWTQQQKLIGTGNIGPAGQGNGSAISGDGNTALIMGVNDNTNIGAGWIWTRSGGVWTQQQKLVGTGGIGSLQRYGSLSADGNTALISGSADNTNQGAAWVWTRSGIVWTQQGSKFQGTGLAGSAPRFGTGVSLSADGNTALIGGGGDNTDIGAAWVFVTGLGGPTGRVRHRVVNR